MAQPLGKQLRRLQDLRPTIIVAPPSLLRQLVGKMIEGQISLNPERVISVAEPLDPIDEQLLQEVFGQTIHQVYQATEGFIGATCSYGTIHLNEDTMIVEREYLDERRFIPIITDFRRKSQPIIRYRLDDVLHLLDEPCPCGSIHTALKAIEGRRGDVFELSQKQGGNRLVYADFLRRRILMSADVLDYGLRQTQSDRFELYIAAEQEQESRQRVKSGLLELLDEFGCLPVQIVDVSHWPSGGLRKRKRIEVTWKRE